MAKPDLELDHLVITCHRLGDGMRYVERMFGVAIPPGGQHDFMGTHNAVMAVGDGIYLEVIAIDPSLPAPPGPRWFGLGNILVDDRLKDQPVLAHFVLRTTDMAATLSDLPRHQAEIIGPPRDAARGDLRWQITLNPTGLPPEGGCLPALIQWNGVPPQYRMAAPGPKLDRLYLCHDAPTRLESELRELGAGNLLDGGLVTIEMSDRPYLKADFSHNGRSIFI